MTSGTARVVAAPRPLRSRAMSVNVPDSIFKAYDVRGLYGDEITGDVAELIGRGFARTIGELSGKPTGELRLVLGAICASPPPSSRAATPPAWSPKVPRCSTPGRSARSSSTTLVGSRNLDGGLMCTASHNPKAYTGAKLVGEGALALSGDSGIQEVRRYAQSDLPAPDPAQAGSIEPVDIAAEFRAAVLEFVDADKIDRSLKIVVDGGNGMAGEMVGPVFFDELGIDLSEHYWVPNGEFPDHESPTRSSPRTANSSCARWSRRVPTSASRGTRRRPLLLHRRSGQLRRRRLPHGPARRVAPRQDARRRHPLRRPREPRRRRRRPHERRDPAHQPRRPRLLQDAHAQGGRPLRRRGERPLLLPRLLLRRLRDDPALLILELLSEKGQKLSELLDPLRSRYFISGEINSKVDDADAKIAAIEAKYSDAEITYVDGVSIDYEDWHFNVRKSNTEPLLRLTLESLVSQEDMEAKRDEVLALIRG